MKFISFLLIVLFTNLIFCQSFSEADAHFNRFEYAETISVLEAIEKKSKFELDQLKQLGYSYYAIGNFEKALPIIDSILMFKPVEAYFYFMQAESNMATGKYEKALEGYKKFNNQDGSINVDLRIESVNEISSWPSIEIDRIVESSANHNKASVLGEVMGTSNLVYKEVGVNKQGQFLSSEEEINNAELLLMRPYLSEESLTPITVLGSEDFWSIHDIAIEPNTNKVLVSLSKPMAQKKSEQVIKIYEGLYNSALHQLEILKPWSLLDSENHITSGFASYNFSGSIVAFSMSSESSQGVDIYWMKKQTDGTWGNPISITEINSPLDDVYPRFIGDSILTFSSNGRKGYGGLDLYKISVDGSELVESSLKHLPYPINSFRDDYNLQMTGDSLISLTSNRLGKTTDDNILHIYLPIKETQIEEPPIDPNAIFLSQWEIKFLYFDFDKFNILRDSKDVDFEGLKAFLMANPNYKIELKGKTDNRGTDEYNYELGLKRAESVKEELVAFGFNSEQIIALSTGKSEPLVDCKKGCSEEEHAKNRVVTIELLLVQ